MQATVIRDAVLPKDLDDVASLWFEYLAWADEEVATRYGWVASAREETDQDIAGIAKYQPPDGRLILAFEGDHPIGTVAMQRIGPGMAEIKRMYVRPAHRRTGVGRALIEQVIVATRGAGIERVRLDSPDFMTAAHRLYRSLGFVDIVPYPESEIPVEYHHGWLFMERTLT